MNNHENKLLTVLGKFTDSLLLNLLFLISCVPVITIGVSVTAFYYTLRKVLKQDRGYLWAEYKRAWKENFKQATLCWLLFLVIGAVLTIDIYVMYQAAAEGAGYGMSYLFFAVLFVILVLWAVYTFAYLARFENTTKAVLKNSILFMFANMAKTLLVLLVFGISSFLVWLTPFSLVIVPLLCGWYLEVILESVFRKYMSEEDRKAEDERNQDFYET